MIVGKLAVGLVVGCEYRWPMTAGNDGHWVDLNNVHIQKAPAHLKYVVEWHPEQTDLSSVIDTELQLIRDEIAEGKLNRDGSPVE